MAGSDFSSGNLQCVLGCNQRNNATITVLKTLVKYSHAGPQSITVALKRSGGIVRQEDKFSRLNDLISLKYKVTYGQFHSFYS